MADQEKGGVFSIFYVWRDLSSVPLRTFGPLTIRFGHLPLVLGWFMTLVVWGLVSVFAVGDWVFLPSLVNLAFLATAVVIATRGDRAASEFLGKFLQRTRLDPPVLHKRFTYVETRPVNRWLVRHLVYALVAVALATLVVLNTLVKPLTFNEAYLLVTGGDITRKSLFVAFIELAGYSLVKVPGNSLWQKTAALTLVTLGLLELGPVSRKVFRETTVFRYLALAIFVVTIVQLVAWFIPYACPWPYSVFATCPTAP